MSAIGARSRDYTNDKRCCLGSKVVIITAVSASNRYHCKRALAQNADVVNTPCSLGGDARAYVITDDDNVKRRTRLSPRALFLRQ